MDLDINVWGFHFWMCMYSVALSYPENPTDIDKQSVTQFFSSIAYVLPCNSCRSEYSEMLKKYPLNDYIDNRTMLERWIGLVENNISNNLGKPGKVTENVKSYLQGNLSLELLKPTKQSHSQSQSQSNVGWTAQTPRGCRTCGTAKKR